MSIHITGVGSHIPKQLVKNSDFLEREFVNEDSSEMKDPNAIVIEKFKKITGIEERRYAEKDQITSQMAFEAAKNAIESSNTDPETLDYIIVAHNFGDIAYDSNQSDTVPSLASRVKHNLKIKKNSCVAYDMLFGCPGWLEGTIQAQAFIKAGMAKKCLVIGAEMLSRVVDIHDRDSMIFSDGAGATIIEETDEPGGILAHESASYTYEEAFYLGFSGSYQKEKAKDKIRYIKMAGRKIYNFSLTHVPKAMKSCLEKSGHSIDDLKKIFLHQANEKMDYAICDRFYKLFEKPVPEHVMPMSIQKLGNSSVATLPTLLDMVTKNEIENQSIHKGDIILFASVGAGMNINAMVYQY